MSSIERSDQLTKVFVSCLTSNGLSMVDLARLACLGYNTVYRVRHPQEPKGVSNKAFVKMVEAMRLEPKQKINLYSLAGIDITKAPVVGLFAARVGRMVDGLQLNPENEALLERLTLEHIEAIGGLLKAAQESSIKRRRVHKKDGGEMERSFHRWRRITF